MMGFGDREGLVDSIDSLRRENAELRDRAEQLSEQLRLANIDQANCEAGNAELRERAEKAEAERDDVKARFRALSEQAVDAAQLHLELQWRLADAESERDAEKEGHIYWHKHAMQAEDERDAALAKLAALREAVGDYLSSPDWPPKLITRQRLQQALASAQADDGGEQ